MHPGAWWVWALGAAVVASRTTNLVLLLLVSVAVGLVVVTCRRQAPWAMAFRLYVYLAIIVVGLRLAFRVIFAGAGATVVIRLPVVVLPGVLSGIRLFGPVSAEALLAAGAGAAQLGAMIIAIGGANALANAKRLLKAVPAALYEWGTVIVIAVSVFPQLAESITRVRRARQLRADTGRGLHLIRNVAMPVLADALDRSLLLAGAMDSRGYGRTAALGRSKTATTWLLGAATVAVGIGAYGLLDTSGGAWWRGAPMVGLGLVVGVVGLWLAGRRVSRSRYRPDRLDGLAWAVMACGGMAAGLAILASLTQPSLMYPSSQPLAWPPVNLWSLAPGLVLSLPAVFVRPARRPSVAGRTDDAWPAASVGGLSQGARSLVSPSAADVRRALR